MNKYPAILVYLLNEFGHVGQKNLALLRAYMIKSATRGVGNIAYLAVKNTRIDIVAVKTYYIRKDA